MIPGRVSVIIPARNERYLEPTIHDLLAKAAGDVEILPVLDGVMSDGQFQSVPVDPRVKPIYHREPAGMRPSINEAAVRATGQYLLKCDGHMIAEAGYDAALKEVCDPVTLVVPTRHSIDPETWTVRRRDYNYHFLTFPFTETQYGMGLHAVTADWKLNKNINAERAHIQVDDLLSFQGSCWMQRTKTFLDDGPLDHRAFGFYGESQETGLLRYWLRGRRCVIVKTTAISHLHKGRDYTGADGRGHRGFFLSLKEKRGCEARITDICTRNQWPGQRRTFESVIEQFWPLLSRMKDPRYSWPSDWRDWERHRAAFENRPPEKIPPHL